MTCERFAELLDHVEWSDPLPPPLAAHAAECSRCAALAAAVTASIAEYRQSSTPASSSMAGLAGRVMTALPDANAPRRLVSMVGWLAAGAILLVSMVLVPLLAGFRALTNGLGSNFTLPLALVLGSAMTIYAVMFVFSHMEELARRLPGAPGHARHGALV